VIAAILSLHIRHVPRVATRRMREEFQSGFTYVRDHRALLGLAILGFAATFLGNPVLTFLPLFAQDVLRGDVTQYTYLMSSAGAGAVAGALVVAWRGRFPHMGRTVLLIQIVFGAIVALFAVTRYFWINAALLFAAGSCMVIVFATLASLVQLNAPNEMRGRVMSLYMVAFRGGMPLGSLAGGWLATMTSAPTVLIVNGLLLSAVAVVVLARNRAIREL
jgi:predicted MFS family arabinose efflux permease